MVEGRIYSMRRMMSEVADIDPRVLASLLYFLKMLRTHNIKQNRTELDVLRVTYKYSRNSRYIMTMYK